MSRLRTQLLKLLPELNEEAKHLRNAEARHRWNLIRYILKSKLSVRQACFKVQKSEDFFRKWGTRLLEARSVTALTPLSKRPRKCPRGLHKVWEERIVKIRQANPFEGADRISNKIEEIFGRRIAPSTVNKVLKRNNLISKVRSKRLHKKHLKRYRRPLPGYLQMDFKYVPYRINGQQYYQLSCVDHHSSWRMIRIYDQKDLGAVESFLHELETECPFPILQIQTDNDLAFTHKFWRLRMGFDPTFAHPLAQWCQDNGVVHKLIPVGEKELNGKVENTHRQDDRELFSQINPQNLTHLQALSLVYEERWNNKRKTRALRWHTPWQTIQKAYALAIVYCRCLGLEGPKTVIKIRKAKKLKARQTKRKGLVSRYLNWMEKDAKKYGS